MKTIGIVTGASSGIGKEFFLSLTQRADAPEEIWVVARNEAKLNELRSLTDIPLRVFPIDLSKENASHPILDALQAEEICVRYLICASGFGRFQGIQDDDAAVLENMVDLNCRSIVGMTHAVAPFMEKGGAMLLIASVAAFQPIPYIATYAATKAFVLSYGRALNRELRKTKGARCMCICPFWTKTEFFNRAIDKDEDAVVKHYAVMYEPKQIVGQAWKDLKKKTRDVSIYGAYAKGQAALVKLLPHKLVMNVWQNQQKLN